MCYTFICFVYSTYNTSFSTSVCFTFICFTCRNCFIIRFILIYKFCQDLYFFLQLLTQLLTGFLIDFLYFLYFLHFLNWCQECQECQELKWLFWKKIDNIFFQKKWWTRFLNRVKKQHPLLTNRQLLIFLNIELETIQVLI